MQSSRRINSLKTLLCFSSRKSLVNYSIVCRKMLHSKKKTKTIWVLKFKLTPKSKQHCVQSSFYQRFICRHFLHFCVTTYLLRVYSQSHVQLSSLYTWIVSRKRHCVQSSFYKLYQEIFCLTSCLEFTLTLMYNYQVSLNGLTEEKKMNLKHSLKKNCLL